VGLEEGGELTDADQVAGHGAVGEVRGAQAPLEGAAVLLEDALLSMLDRSAVMRSPSVMRPHQMAHKAGWNSECAGQAGVVGVTGFEPVTSSL
jgi:hypothetical protein